ncbi:hypothetical protein ABPG72_000654 [Tetrahymena utriculariae]
MEKYIEQAKCVYNFSLKAVRFIGPLNIVFAGVAFAMFYENNYKKLYLNPRYSYTMPYLQSAKITKNLYEKL